MYVCVEGRLARTGQKIKPRPKPVILLINIIQSISQSISRLLACLEPILQHTGLKSHVTNTRIVCLVFVGRSLARRPSNVPVYLRDGEAEATVLSHNVLTQAQPLLLLTLYRQLLVRAVRV